METQKSGYFQKSGIRNIYFFSDGRKDFPINKDNKHEKFMSGILNCKQLHLYIYLHKIGWVEKLWVITLK